MTPAVLGLHIGGSKTHALKAASGADTAAGEGVELTEDSANLASLGHQRADAVLRRIAAELGDGVQAVYAGAAGADTPANRAVLAALLTEHFPGARIDVVHDTRIILAASGLQSGAVLVAGTGSVAWGLTPDGREARAGGYGYLLGDEGGGYSVVRDAVRETLREYYAGLEPGPLAQALLSATTSADPLQLMDLYYRKPEPRYWAGLSSLVFELAAAGDREAAHIVADAAYALAALARQVHGSLGTELPLILAGGLLLKHPELAAAVARKLEPEDPGKVRLLERAPVHGAVELARRGLAQAGA
ncbi:N-acetylglucosamine kinase [Arthrobacter sp. CJ23]|uniref:N-acetylglucosamine kinase n=1 Tax=Arthrobacter sp. CJ23 TaxID=2972479 RepID=UPI00215C6378|nr:BadF/BadG/BcrA/BcrD ATPase family protein [Arthrobacter sp. CJ23]UVJ41456.1 ATPase [Arthrobacter sp. CJ23]